MQMQEIPLIQANFIKKAPYCIANTYLQVL